MSECVEDIKVLYISLLDQEAVSALLPLSEEKKIHYTLTNNTYHFSLFLVLLSFPPLATPTM